MAIQVLEGSWEEIAAQAETFKGKQVRLTIYDIDEPEEKTPQMLDKALEGLIGVVNSSEANGGKPSRLSEDESAFGECLLQKRRDGTL